MNLRIVKLTEDKYQDWDSFCFKSDDAWFWHTLGWLNYTWYYRPELKTKDFSFLVYKNNTVVAIVPLTLEVYKKGYETVSEFSFGGSAIPGPALANNLEKIEKDRLERDRVYDLIFNEIDRLARENNVKRVSIRQAPLSKSFLNKGIPFNYLMRFGYTDNSLNTRLIDLHKNQEGLWNDLRRNHRRNIKKGDKFKVTFYTKENITEELFMNYKELHRMAAGRQTRPDATFELMYQWLEQGSAFLTAVKFENKFIGFEYYSIYKNNVYGFSAANDPDYERDFSIRHLLEWETICWMKKKGFDFYEIGLQQFGILPYDFPDKKQLDISHFKKGFGGFIVPLFIGEKYYDKTFFLKTYQDRVKKFADSL